MSQVMSKLNIIASRLNHKLKLKDKYKHKLGESTSSRPGWMVRDSHLTHGGLRMTNITAGTFTKLISTNLILLFSFLFLPALFSDVNVSATESNISISMSSNPTVSIASSTDGKFADSGNSTITITTNHASGYTLTAKASSSTSLVGANTGNNLATLDSGTAINADTFSNASNTQYNDKWGYKPSKYNSIDNTTPSTSFYYPSPGLDTAQSPLDTLDITNSASGSPYTYTVSIGARVSTATAIDSYSNSFVFAVVGNPTQYTITYNANAGSDTVTNMPSPNPDSGSANGETVTNAISATVPERDGYNFKGWCSTTTSDETCSGTTYNPDGDGTNRNITLNQQSSTNTFTLYAMWESSSYTVTFKANGGTGSDYAQTINDTDYLSGNSFTRSNYYFKGWGTGTGSVTYRPGQSITPTNNMTLYAIWGSSTNTSLYNIVASLNNSRTLDDTNTNGTGLNAKAGIQAAITKDNSGVFTYNTSTFGTPSDAATTSTIYLYRGILDNILGTYGSNGDGGNYPNFVILQAGSSKTTTDTCWRIVRTTGSGGVKMIYNGKWSGSTCANVGYDAYTDTLSYYLRYNDNGKSIIGAGYTYNASYKSTTASTQIGTLFGTNSNYSNNNTNSYIKEYIENTWFANISSYESKLESSAGFCNDRTIYANKSYDAPLAESTSISTPYATASSGNTLYRFGAGVRNTGAGLPTLTCATHGSVNRSIVDLYTTKSATNGNKQLSKPAAILTADEFTFAGAGRSIFAKHKNTYLISGQSNWLLSPQYRGANGSVYLFDEDPSGTLYQQITYQVLGVRPSISLTSGTIATSGSGTATDPWVVPAP